MVKQDFGTHLEGDVKQILWVDYDNDGLIELFLCVNQGFNKLYRNTGSFNFEDVSLLAGLLQNTEPTANYGACFFDFDRDGDLDLYVATYTVGQLAPSRLNKLYRNNGNGTFTDITIESGVFIGANYSFQTVAVDFNNDVWPDLYIINDREYSNKLFINNGNLLFTETAQAASADLPDQDSMCGAAADFNNDGNIDVFVSNSTGLNRHAHLLVNQGDGTFLELANQYGVGQNGISWGA